LVGGFTVPATRPNRFLLIRGSGITPVLSIMRTLAVEDHAGKVCFLYYAENAVAIPHPAELVEIAAARPFLRRAVAVRRSLVRRCRYRRVRAAWPCDGHPIGVRR